MASITTYMDKPANDTQAQRTFPCYDYEGDISPKYDLTGPLVPVAIESGCVLTLPTNPYPSTNTSYESSFVLLAREQMESHLCVHAGQALDDLSHVISRLSELGYPPVRVAVIAANSDSDQNFGSSDEEYFFDYESVKPAHVAFSLVGRDTARHLWSASTLAGPFIVRVVQDQGIWNRDRHSVWNKFRTALAWSSLVPLMVVGVVLIVQSIRVTGRWFSVQVFIFTGALMYLAGGLIAPISTTQNRAQVYCRYIAWMAGYICYSWVLLSWAVIIKKTQSPRFLKAIWAASYLGMAVMFFYAILNITLTIYPTTPGQQLKKWSSFIILPLTMLIQGVVLFFYGMRFLMFIKDSILFANIRVALRKLTVLSLATFVGFIIFAVCGTLNQSILHSAPWILTLRSVLYNTTVFLLVAMIFWVVRIQTSSTFGYRRNARSLLPVCHAPGVDGDGNDGGGGGNDGRGEPNYDKFNEVIKSNNTLPLPDILDMPTPTHRPASIKGHSDNYGYPDLWASYASLQSAATATWEESPGPNRTVYRHNDHTAVSLHRTSGQGS